MNFKIAGSDVFALIEAHLQHLIGCEGLLFDLYDHESKPLFVNTYRDHDGKSQPLSLLDRGKLDDAIRYVEQHRVAMNDEARMQILRNLPPVHALVADLPRLRKAARIVDNLQWIASVEQIKEQRFRDRFAALRAYEREGR